MNIPLSIATDYATSSGSAEPYLEKIARAGFTHVHWCHDWNVDKRYSAQEKRQIQKWLQATGLHLLDIHAASTPETNWASPVESIRRQGLDLIINRIDMAAELGAQAVVLHAADPIPGMTKESYQEQISFSLDYLQPEASAEKVSIALENLIGDDFSLLTRIFQKFDSNAIGLCYDSGHGNIHGKGLDFLEKYPHRLVAVHLHDNDGAWDQHKIPFHGTVDWKRLAGIISRSSYHKCLNLEVGMRNHAFPSEDAFLQEAHATGIRLTKMVDSNHQNSIHTDPTSLKQQP